MDNDKYLFKEDIDGVSWKSCSELGSSHSLKGEQNMFPCGGHAIDIYAEKDG